jgi:hypothetical protein
MRFVAGRIAQKPPKQLISCVMNNVACTSRLPTVLPLHAYSLRVHGGDMKLPLFRDRALLTWQHHLAVIALPIHRHRIIYLKNKTT